VREGGILLTIERQYIIEVSSEAIELTSRKSIDGFWSEKLKDTVLPLGLN
jgi:hypothetical protein